MKFSNILNKKGKKLQRIITHRFHIETINHCMHSESLKQIFTKILQNIRINLTRSHVPAMVHMKQMWMNENRV